MDLGWAKSVHSRVAKPRKGLDIRIYHARRAKGSIWTLKTNRLGVIMEKRQKRILRSTD